MVRVIHHNVTYLFCCVNTVFAALGVTDGAKALAILPSFSKALPAMVAQLKSYLPQLLAQ